MTPDPESRTPPFPFWLWIMFCVGLGVLVGIFAERMLNEH